MINLTLFQRCELRHIFRSWLRVGEQLSAKLQGALFLKYPEHQQHEEGGLGASGCQQTAVAVQIEPRGRL